MRAFRICPRRAAHRLSRFCRRTFRRSAGGSRSAAVGCALHVGTLSSDNSAGVYYAKELGYFQKVGARRHDRCNGQRSGYRGRRHRRRPRHRRRERRHDRGRAHARRTDALSVPGLDRGRRNDDRPDRGGKRLALQDRRRSKRENDRGQRLARSAATLRDELDGQTWRRFQNRCTSSRYRFLRWDKRSRFTASTAGCRSNRS